MDKHCSGCDKMKPINQFDKWDLRAKLPTHRIVAWCEECRTEAARALTTRNSFDLKILDSYLRGR
jgi:hypothetical protein